ncbi:MAG: SPOR domain-containing protein [Nitrosomonas sp.]|jgi:DedD protein|nr:SPOR domain-containing protein [Nitrosomonas sp.]MCC7135235.1 SPOR domain-containing protein [Nitrosomonas sp.]
MNRNISEEENLLRKRARRRLVGAITLVILAVVFLPMILDDEPKPEQQEIDILIPPENLVDESYPWITPENHVASDDHKPDLPQEGLPLPFSDEISAMTADNVPDSVSTDGRIPVPVRKPARILTVTQSSPEKKTTPESVSSVKNSEGAYVIQLGAFSDPSKAGLQKQNLIAGGVNAYTETINIGGNEMTRVRIGPFATRELAEIEHDRLKQLGLSGVVTSK